MADVYGGRAAWADAVERSDVRLQWDPDHGPRGEPLERRAIQLGIRGEALAKYAGEWTLGIEDVSEFVRTQAARLSDGREVELVTPKEAVYAVRNVETAQKLGVVLDSATSI